MAPNMEYAPQEHPHFNLPSHHSMQSLHSRASPDLLNSDAAERPLDVDMDMQAFSKYPFMPTPSTGHDEPFGDLQSFTHSQSRQMMMMQDSGLSMQHTMMNKFFYDNSTWDPVKGRQPTVGFPLGNEISNLSVYRDPAGASECDTIGPSVVQSDSGYGSYARQSIRNPSVYDDVDYGVDHQNLVTSFVDFQLQQGASPESIPSQESDTPGKPWNQYGVSTSSESRPLICTFCDAKVRTRSQLNKHQQRHTKPFRCKEPDCPRTDGFSTKNDLTRHMQCVHNSNGVRYRCNIDQCKNKNKDWPRADNFRQHLKRMHQKEVGLDELDSFIYRSGSSFIMPSTPEELTGLGLPEAAPTQPATTTHLDHVSQETWVGLDHSQAEHMEPMSAFLGETIQGQMGDITQLTDLPQSMDELDFGALTVAEGIQYPDQGLLEGVTMGQELDHMPSSVDNRQMFVQHPRFVCQEGQSMVDHPYIDPNSLTHVTMVPFYSGTQTENEDYLSDMLEPEVEISSVSSYEDSPGGSYEDEHDSSNQPDVADLDEPKEMDEPTGMHEPTEMDEPTELDDAVEPGLQDRFDLQDTVVMQYDVAMKDTPNAGEIHMEGLCDPRPIVSSLSAGIDSFEEPKSDDRPSPADLKSLDCIPEAPTLDEDEAEASAVVQSLKEKGLLHKIMLRFGYQPSLEAEEEASDGDPLRCDQCKKKFSRRCELKKHRRRHDKPYACTFTHCDKRFGSKNDWKRHENSQHFQLEYWRCDEKREEGLVCGKICHRRETFRTHLKNDHEIKDNDPLVEKKQADCRIGRNCESRFWCGFCKETITLRPEAKGPLAWAERFDHIDDHYHGRNSLPKMTILDWTSVDSSPLEVAAKPTEDKSEDSHSRKRRRDSDDEVSVVSRKRFKAHARREAFWSCCACNNYWSPKTTDACLEASCSHPRCENCPMEMHKVTEETRDDHRLGV
ncbi:hypothetical protein B0T17DRAFT_50489 [Bombardia bombarda]|uniref:C2H2-type domain-containing protein n=1 Tax=Bombardia bombarda TaxID=252184 RepID=A0AA39XKJ8_9PEZI|nr:hypothetical protein B0T17DRAFT_50489 [Bombardia bombarda]